MSAEIKKEKELTELEKLELENKRLEQEERTLHLQELRESLDRSKMEKAQQFAIYRERGQVIDTDKAKDANFAASCSHRKGGEGMDGLNGRGDDTDYAVFKMQWFAGETIVKCLRCPKIWKPVRLEQFAKVENGKAVAPLAPYTTVEEATAAFKTAWDEYRQACAFPTKNRPMQTARYTFNTEEAKKRYQEYMDNLSLR